MKHMFERIDAMLRNTSTRTVYALIACPITRCSDMTQLRLVSVRLVEADASSESQIKGS